MTYLKTFYRFFLFSISCGRGPSNKVRIFYLLVKWRIEEHWPRLARRLPKLSRIVFSLHDRDISLVVPDDLTFAAVFYEIFVREDYHSEFKESPRIILDLGAQFGLASVYFAALFPSAVIHAFEPSSRNFDYLQRNAAPYPNILPHQIAIFSHEGKVRLNLDDELGGGNNSLMRSYKSFEEVDCTTLDHFVQTHGITKVDLLKIDVEGAEEGILKDCSFLPNIDRIIGELHFDYVDKDQMIALLERTFHLTINYIHPLCPVFSGVNKALSST